MMENNYISALTIDVEDGINILMRDVFNIDMPPSTRVIENTNLILDLFEAKNVKGTFFILGEIAEHYPTLVKAIASRGHEIGVHGYYHDQIFKMTKERAKTDITRAKELIEDISGEKVYGFRAPAFSINERTSWILEILAEIGFRYDSSIMPIKTRKYGWPDFDEGIHKIELKSGNSIIEVPLSVARLFGKKMPACGGGYLRYLPYAITKKAFKQILNNRPAILYLHPYEIDTTKYPDYFYKARSSMPLTKKIPLSLYRLNKGTVLRKLQKLLDEFSFRPMNSIIDTYKENGNIKVTTL